MFSVSFFGKIELLDALGPRCGISCCNNNPILSDGCGEAVGIGGGGGGGGVGAADVEEISAVDCDCSGIIVEEANIYSGRAAFEESVFDAWLDMSLPGIMAFAKMQIHSTIFSKRFSELPHT